MQSLKDFGEKIKTFDWKRFVVIMPVDPFYHTWKILGLIITLLSSVMYGYFAALRRFGIIEKRCRI